MSKLLKGMAVGVVVLGTFLVSPIANAEPVCEIGYTGPNSDNMCITTTRYACSVVNNNEVVITDKNNQHAVSGTAILESNGSGGNATSGSVTNDNGTVFNFVIENSGPFPSEDPGVCVVTASVPATEEPEVPANPGAPVEPTVTGQGAVSQLPVTDGDSSGPALVALAATIGGLAIVSVIAALVYGNRAKQ